jgi:hypothetical protein
LSPRCAFPFFKFWLSISFSSVFLRAASRAFHISPAAPTSSQSRHLFVPLSPALKNVFAGHWFGAKECQVGAGCKCHGVECGLLKSHLWLRTQDGGCPNDQMISNICERDIYDERQYDMDLALLWWRLILREASLLSSPMFSPFRLGGVSEVDLGRPVLLSIRMWPASVPLHSSSFYWKTGMVNLVFYCRTHRNCSSDYVELHGEKVE